MMLSNISPLSDDRLLLRTTDEHISHSNPILKLSGKSRKSSRSWKRSSL